MSEPRPGWSTRQFKAADKETDKWPRQMQINAGIGHIKTRWHEKTIAQLRKRIRRLRTELESLKGGRKS